MAKRGKVQHPNQWPNVAAVTDLPNVSGAPTQSTDVDVGDTCYVIASGAEYTCTDATLGSALWVVATRRAYTLYVGNELEGDLAADYDYLDPGDGSGIASALTFMYGKRGTVHVRRGTYTRPVDATTLDLYGSNITLQGEGIGATVIVGRAGDVATRPWETFAITGTNCTIQDLSIELPDRDPTCPVAGTALGAIRINAQQSHVRRVTVTAIGAPGTNVWTAYALPLSAVAFEFTSSGNIGQNVVEDVTLNTTYAVVTPHATQAAVFVGASFGATDGTTSVDAFSSLGATQTEPVINRLIVYGQSSEAGLFPYYTYGIVATTLCEFTVRNSRFTGVLAGSLVSVSSSATLITTRGPVFENVFSYAANGLAATFFASGCVLSFAEVGGTFFVTRVHIKGLECFGGATSTHAPGVTIRAPTSLFGLVLDGVQVYGATVGTAATVGIDNGGISGPIFHAIKLDSNTALSSIDVNNCTDANFAQCVTDTLTIGAGMTNTVITGCRVTNAAGYLDSGTGTSIANTPIG